MKAFVSRSQKGLESLAIEEIAEPAALGYGQVRIAMRAASINYRDLLAISGFLGPSAFEYLIPVSDGAGEVIEIAADVWRVKVGERVALTFNPDWIGGDWQPSLGARGRGGSSLQGVMCEQVVVMYGGRIMERGTVAQVTADPKHPYTIGLLGSIARREKRGRRLDAIGGAVPNPLDMPSGCPFQPRCPRAMDACATDPGLREQDDGRRVACWLY